LLVNLKGKEDLRDLGINGKILFKRILNKACYGMNWIQLAQDNIQWCDNHKTSEFQKMQGYHYHAERL
jgi:hypothetical protein